MKYNTFIFRGHNNKTIGAAANGYKEYEVAQKIVSKVVNGLVHNGYKVQTNNIEEDNYTCNLTKGNSYSQSGLSIHLNSGGGKGVEFIKSFNGNIFHREFRILKRLENLGFVNRGVKSRSYKDERFYQRNGLDNLINFDKDYYAEIRNAKENGNDLGILEIGFIDNKEDMDLLINNIDEIANIIVEEYIK